MLISGGGARAVRVVNNTATAQGTSKTTATIAMNPENSWKPTTYVHRTAAQSVHQTADPQVSLSKPHRPPHTQGPRCHARFYSVVT